mgnify:CR=1 FL=1
MRILNFGSLNLDYVYRVHAFVRPGETAASLGDAAAAEKRAELRAGIYTPAQ